MVNPVQGWNIPAQRWSEPEASETSVTWFKSGNLRHNAKKITIEQKQLKGFHNFSGVTDSVTPTFDLVFLSIAEMVDRQFHAAGIVPIAGILFAAVGIRVGRDGLFRRVDNIFSGRFGRIRALVLARIGTADKQHKQSKDKSK